MAIMRWVLSGVMVLLLLQACSGSDSKDGELAPAPLQDFTAEKRFKKLWSNAIGNGQGGIYNRLQPVIAGDSIYAVAANGELEAIALADGDSRWDIDLDQPVVGGLAAAGDTLLLGLKTGELLALAQDDGRTLWQIPLGAELLAPPASDGERVFAQTFSGQLIALDINSGARLWSFNSTMPVLTLRGTSTPVVQGRLVIAGFANGKVVAFDTQSGAVTWEQRVGTAKGNSEIERIVDIDAPLFLDNGVLYAVSYNGNVMALEPNSGRVMWVREVSSTVAMSQGFANLYVASSEGSVLAMMKNGQGVRWEQTVLSRRKLSGTAVLGSYVVVGDFEGYLHALSQVDGHMAARIRVDSDGMQTPFLSHEDMLLVYTNSGDLVAYKLKDL